MALPAWAGSNSTTLPNGAELKVSIDSPADGTQFLADGAPVPVPVSGTASIGLGTPQATIVYVLDASGSTMNSSGTCSEILTCEKTFFTGLNNAAAASGSVNHVGLVVFGNDAVQADMTPAGGDDPLGAPGDANTPIGSVALTNGGFNYHVGQYTGKDGDANGTNYAAALQQAVNELNASTDTKKLLVFVSDGLSNAGTLAAFNAAVAAIPTGTIVNSIAIAGGACTGGSAGDLADIGPCVNVPDPNDLPDLIPNLIGSTLTKVELSVDGGTPTAVTTTPATPQNGPASVTYSTMTAGLDPGSHEICVTAFGTDVTGGSAQTTTCVDIGVYDLELAPETATNELGTDTSHTVTATLQGPAGAVGGYLVDFAVTGQNAGATGTCVPADCKTDATGQVAFTYSVPVANSSLGTDKITASVTLADPTGATDEEDVTKDWVDTTPPVASCTPTTNPGGKNIPPAGNNPQSGQNPDGFYLLTATDLVDDNPEITVSDTDSSFVAGPYASGTKIKLVQTPGGNPNVKPGPGVIDWHITLNGDAEVTATDFSGNSVTVSCKVPPPPK
ncbi:MAG TPA: vWA domain-containing protein [Gaiella sp.]|nr:vWA domain-containing protein [Gaiella sp.]